MAAEAGEGSTTSKATVILNHRSSPQVKLEDRVGDTRYALAAYGVLLKAFNCFGT